ncbi:hypothetical protein, partial [Vibrio alginolyticus]|uniref:hypothetical protein n=1 Tax=Vibrio alginolyticus TaxID=663 RepID=UPI003D7DCF79
PPPPPPPPPPPHPPPPPPHHHLPSSSAASDVYKRQTLGIVPLTVFVQIVATLSLVPLMGYNLSLIHISEPTRRVPDRVCRLRLER